MTSNLPAAILGVLGVVALVVVQFTPWGGISTEEGDVFGFTFPASSIDAYTWKVRIEAGGSQEKESWYSSDLESDEDDGDDDNSSHLLMIRIAIPVLLAGFGVGALGALLAFLGRGPSPLLLIVGGVLAGIGTLLFALGVDGFFDSDQDWNVAFYLAIAGSVLTLVGGIVGTARGIRS